MYQIPRESGQDKIVVKAREAQYPEDPLSQRPKPRVRTATIAALIALISVLATLEVTSFLALRRHRLFVRETGGGTSSSEVDERTHLLFTRLDPSLGYAHRTDYVPQAKDPVHLIGLTEGRPTVDGFVILEHLDGAPPLKIAVLGSSTSDPWLFNGNWPRALHRTLTERGIPHVIYNGAVSGYNSHQTLIKLIRDVLNRDRMDYVILYHGGNDAPGNGDTVEGHPAIHPYQVEILRSVRMVELLRPEQSDSDASPLLLPNLAHALRTLNRNWGAKPAPLQLGVRNDAGVDQYVRNLEYMNAICALQGTRFLYFPEVFAEDAKQLVPPSHPHTEDAATRKAISDFLTSLTGKLGRLPFSHPLQERIPRNEPVFFDSTHMNDAGNTLVAREIARYLSGRK